MKLLTLKEYQDQYDEDFEISRTKLIQFSIDLPILYNKYLRYYYYETQNFNKGEAKLKQLYFEIYYEYKEKHPYPLKNSECEWHTESDKRYQELYLKVQYLKQKVKYLEKVVRQIPYLSNTVKNIIEMIKFENGT